jgi:diguanylate cyclase (GGDEF)-like protein
MGIFVLNKDLRVVLWNRWLEENSRIRSEEVLSRDIMELFPELERKGFRWKSETVFKLGNFSFFSQQLHSHLIPLQLSRYLTSSFEHMQQNATLSPLRDEEGKVAYLCVSIEDTTDAVLYRERLEKAKKELETMSLTDALTDLPNRRHLMDTLECEISKHERHNRPLSLAILDVDHFKDINDTYGHICGDQALSGLAKVFPKHLRTYDFVARYGGEEFCVVLANTKIEEAIVVMERLRVAVEATPLQADGQSIHLTLSIGISSNEIPDTVTLDRILGMADDALYKAKSTGRNRTRHFTLDE